MKSKIKKIILAAAMTILASALTLPCAAVVALAEGDLAPRFIDDEGLLTQEQAEELTYRLNEISERHQFDTVVAVVPALDGREARLYAADFFEQNGFGYGEDLDGAILLLATEDRDFGFASLGYGLTAFTPAGQEYLGKLFLPYLREDMYYEAFMAYADAVDDFLTKAEAGAPYDQENIPLTASERSEYRLFAVVASLVLALAIALIVTLIWKMQLKSVVKQDHAQAYVREGSMVLASKNDIFLHRQVRRQQRVEKDKSGSGKGGSFKTSSGRSATGRSGKY